jgi:GTP-binding protein YchF
MLVNKVEICGVDTSKLPVLTNEKMRQLFGRMYEGDDSAREEFIKGNLRLVLSVIQRFNNRGEYVDDLFQVGCIGLIKAIDNFDLSQNVKFSTYAVPMIIGEIRRYLRDNNAIVHVVRCFEDNNITHVEGSVDPIRDIETIQLELIFADLDVLERRIDRTRKMLKSGDKKYQIELDTLIMIQENLEKNIPARNIPLTEEQDRILHDLFLLSSKPVIYAGNISEEDLGKEEDANPNVKALKEYAEKEKAEVIIICAKLEEEIAQLEPNEKKLFLEELGIVESGLDRLVKACYRLLGLISFLTAGPKEVRAWTIKEGTKAPQAAGKIHSDFGRGFIRAEVIPYEILMELKSYTLAKEKGLVRLEGKDYTVKDGDVILFRFNV